ncbi:hypothetical protein M23134_03759 [Microscilla marina ATCC 23134]|uniref:Uncharacterized protein n=1 Tax=Microscilla marina ATCC 23134 TaxID=313606 RepID=A1ZPF2_MICM2|nr:hypothetical protein M23134_03759 [Microscilla marina ATCC 23134]
MCVDRISLKYSNNNQKSRNEYQYNIQQHKVIVCSFVDIQ